MTINPDGLFSTAFKAWGALPRRYWGYAWASGALSAAIDLAYWITGRHPALVDGFLVLVIGPAWLGAVYVATMALIRAEPSWAGFAKFLVVSVVVMAPLLGSLALLLFVAAKMGPNDGATPFLLSFVLVVSCFALTSLLPAWPFSQALSGRLVSPLRVLRATHGHRWSLVFLTFTESSLGNSKLIPEVSKARNLLGAIIFGLGHSLFSAVLGLLTAGVAAAAWTFAKRRDPALDEPAGT